MAGNPLLRGLFGTFQESAAARADTASIWSSLRSAVATWWYGANGLPLPSSESVLQSTGASLLSQQGVTIFDVNQYRSQAGAWAQAKANLQALNPADQITGNAIFTPEWAKTVSAGVPDRYRIRVQWQWTNALGETTPEWKTYELNGPLSSVNNAISQVYSAATGNDCWVAMANLSTPSITDYEIEQI
jgi:hypothetical protein